MLVYAFPVLVAGVAFSINETFDRILLERLLPENLSKTAIGTYSACYKLALFMTLFATAYRLGIEPFFFSRAKDKDAKINYAKINNIKLGMTICYDLRFPSLYRKLAKKDCSIILVPAAFTRPTGKDHWEILNRSRAIENSVYTVSYTHLTLPTKRIV